MVCVVVPLPCEMLMRLAVDAIIFLAPISGFDQVLTEDRSVNRLEDSVLLWKALCSNKLLAKVCASWSVFFGTNYSVIPLLALLLFLVSLLPSTSCLLYGIDFFCRIIQANDALQVDLVLFLNKCDILGAKLRAGVKLAKYVRSYGDKSNDVDSVSKCTFTFYRLFGLALTTPQICARNSMQYIGSIVHYHASSTHLRRASRILGRLRGLSPVVSGSCCSCFLLGVD